MGAQLLPSDCVNGIYLIHALNNNKLASTTLLARTRASLQAWRNRVGHPSSKIVKHLLNKQFLPPSSMKDSSLSISCHMNKSHKISFSATSLTSTHPLEYIYADVWALLLLWTIMVIDIMFHLSTISLDTKYCWLFPIKNKFDVYNIFSQLVPLLEKKFQFKIKNFYSNNRGETSMTLFHCWNQHYPPSLCSYAYLLVVNGL